MPDITAQINCIQPNRLMKTQIGKTAFSLIAVFSVCHFCTLKKQVFQRRNESPSDTHYLNVVAMHEGGGFALGLDQRVTCLFDLFHMAALTQ